MSPNVWGLEEEGWGCRSNGDAIGNGNKAPLAMYPEALWFPDTVGVRRKRL